MCMLVIHLAGMQAKVLQKFPYYLPFFQKSLLKWEETEAHG